MCMLLKFWMPFKPYFYVLTNGEAVEEVSQFLIERFISDMSSPGFAFHLKPKFLHLGSHLETRAEYSTFHKPFSHGFAVFVRAVFLMPGTVDSENTISF
ncbi:hypothetical protein Trydic_g23132 [Trypoxylus dichotomus]